jgi:toxin ParE1/3/4
VSQVIVRPEAEADLTAIALYVGEQNVDRARALITRLRQRCRILEAQPFAGRPRPELGEGLRSLVERPYLILYRIEGDAAEIVAILHGARDLPAALAARIAREA